MVLKNKKSIDDIKSSLTGTTIEQSDSGRKKNLYLYENNNTAHWVSHSKLKPLDTDDTFKRKNVIDGIQASLTGTTIEQSDLGRKINPYLLEEAEEKESEEVNDDADVNSESNKIDEKTRSWLFQW